MYVQTAANIKLPIRASYVPILDSTAANAIKFFSNILKKTLRIKHIVSMMIWFF